MNIKTESNKCLCLRKAILRCLFPALLFATVMAMSALAGTSHVNDMAGILSGSGTEKVESAIDALCRKTGYDFFAVTTDDNGGMGPQTFAEDYYNAHCTGDNGAVFLIDMGERTMQIVTAGKMIYYLTDERIDRILDHAYDYAADGDYAGAFASMIRDTQSYVSSGTGASHLYDQDTGEIIRVRTLTGTEVGFSLLMGLVSAAGACLIVVASYRMKFSNYKYDFHKHSRIANIDRRDILVGKTVTHRRIPRVENNTRSGGGHHSGGSSFHSGSGGRSFGGGSRKF